MASQTVPFKNILIVGAGGNLIGHHVLQALLADGTFNATVLTREGSKATYPPTVIVKRVPDDLPHKKLVDAFRGQDVVISAIASLAPDSELKLIDAASDAGVRRFVPSEWGMDNGDVNNRKLNPIFKAKAETAEYLHSKESETFSWTAVATSIWLDWALGTRAVGVDPEAREVQYWRGGTHTFSCTTIEYVATAVVAMLKHPNVGKNQRLFLSPFEASQRQIVAELERVLNVKFAVSDADDAKLVQESQDGWEKTKDINYAYQLVTPGVLLPELKAGFASARKKPILEHEVDMPRLTLESVVKDWVANQASAAKGWKDERSFQKQQ